MAKMFTVMAETYDDLGSGTVVSTIIYTGSQEAIANDICAIVALQEDEKFPRITIGDLKEHAFDRFSKHVFNKDGILTEIHHQTAALRGWKKIWDRDKGNLS